MGARNSLCLLFPIIVSCQDTQHVKSQNCFENILLNLKSLSEKKKKKQKQNISGTCNFIKKSNSTSSSLGYSYATDFIFSEDVELRLFLINNVRDVSLNGL